MAKMTNKEMFGMVKSMVLASGAVEVDIQAAVEFLDKQIEQIEKKTENKKLTKAQEANELIKLELAEKIAELGTVTITELQKAGGFGEYSNQKLSALLNQMVKSGDLTKSIGKDRKTVFTSENPKTEIEKENLEIENAPVDEGQDDGAIEVAHEYALMLNSLFNMEKVGA